MFNVFKKQEKFTHKLDMSKITTIAQCRDLIVILNQTLTHTETPCIMKVNDKALNDFPSLNKLKV